MLSLSEFIDKMGITLSPQQALLVKALESNTPLLITVPRCCGKTYLRKLHDDYILSSKGNQ